MRAVRIHGKREFLSDTGLVMSRRQLVSKIAFGFQAVWKWMAKHYGLFRDRETVDFGRAGTAVGGDATELDLVGSSTQHVSR